VLGPLADGIPTADIFGTLGQLLSDFRRLLRIGMVDAGRLMPSDFRRLRFHWPGLHSFLGSRLSALGNECRIG